MNIKYIKMNPTENKTILVETDVERQYQAEVAKQLLSMDADCEQVGFIEKPEKNDALVKLQMMGGEFCGNAAISISSKAASERGIAVGGEMEIPIEISGMEGVLRCKVVRKSSAYMATIKMPFPEEIKNIKLEYEGETYYLPVLFMKGITHIIFPKRHYFEGYEQFAEKAIKKWAKLFDANAVGLLLFDEDDATMWPLVYVKDTDSLCWERGCASGSGAVGYYMAYKFNSERVTPVRQPGGVIVVEVSRSIADNNITDFSITGNVFFEYEGEVEIELPQN